MNIPLLQKENQKKTSVLNIKKNIWEETHLSPIVLIQFLNSVTHCNTEQIL